MSNIALLSTDLFTEDLKHASILKCLVEFFNGKTWQKK